ncbi:Succinyl-diaminopimelate desuccinylase [bioreactor metagenome]|uniref:Succinyl-diaminopimelate desuccinylase n=1 Tax=bioreactor metagenome TaxID=1076179 RepID=A0A645AZZ8_9ZZZZ|nr:YgeY family selenium metabolism-linked hydrolase [Candidatus Pelethousia sp.]
MLSVQVIKEETNAIFNDLVKFSQDLLRIPSYTFQEGKAIKRVIEEMEKLDYDHVYVDETGNALGIIGNGPKTVVFDSHVDTVREGDLASWTVDPFGGECKDENIYGLGASDMKCGGTVTVYAAALMKKLGLCDGKRIVISFSTMEEDLDGIALEHVLSDNGFKADYVIIPEPTDLRLCCGHGGRALYKISMPGVSSHGSSPEYGVNAVYEIQEIVKRVSLWSNRLLQEKKKNGSIALTKIESESASLNAIPYGCNIYLDRRTNAQQSEKELSNEMDELIAGTNATWETVEMKANTWNGEPVVMRSFRPAFELEKTDHLVQACHDAYKYVTGEDVMEFRFKGTTNGVSSAGLLKIPTVIFGAGLEAMCHTANEYCPLENMRKACEFYVALAARL